MCGTASQSSLFPVRSFVLPLLSLFLAAAGSAREFSVVVYNVENFFDVDGVAIYEDYQPEKYTPEHLAVKAGNIAKVLAKVDDGRGPDVVVFNEIELDQTPESTVTDYAAWLASIEDRQLAGILAESPLPAESAGVPAEAWLLKALYDAGLRDYHVAITDEKPGVYDDGRGIAIRNVMFSRFPITDVRSHPTTNARAILEVTLDVEGHPLTLFANHWKSGAGSLEAEEIRLRNAETLRARLDEIFKADPNADVIIAGDFNSHYNQNRRYRDMKRTGINDVLGAQGNELALRRENGPALYNLWFELPSDQRGSDIYRNEWGTLIHLVISRGLYDRAGVQYVDNSFTVLKLPGLNADIFGRPVRWTRGAYPSGFSDHFPLLARFRTVDDNDKAHWIALKQPGRAKTASPKALPVELSSVDLLANAVPIRDLPPGRDLRDGSYQSRVFLVDAPASVNDEDRVYVKVNGEDYQVYTHDAELRVSIREAAKRNSRLRFYGELGTYRGEAQFIVHGKEWFPGESGRGKERTPD